MIRQDKLKELYAKGENISAYLRNEMGADFTKEEIIEISYDLQTGSYIAGMQDPDYSAFKALYTQEIAKEILALCAPSTLMEAGVGEATTLCGVIQNLSSDIKSFSFDISWSRAAYANQWLKKQNIQNATICTGNLLDIPFVDNAIDVVYTSHSIEPNGGKEEEILKELYRVTKKYLILLEPGYELASDAAKSRMDSHGYCKNLKNTAESLGFKVVKYQLFPFSANLLNPTSLLIIEKKEQIEPFHNELFACPKFKTPLAKIGGMYYSENAMSIYPVILDIPCLRIENRILASKYKEFFS